MNRRSVSLGFSDSKVPEGQHICCLFNDDDEKRSLMAKFVESGLQANEKVLYLVDTMTTDEMLDSLEELGVEARSRSADLSLSEAAPTYRPTGVFDPDSILDMVRDFYIDSVEKEGYDGARGAGEMSWCLVDDQADVPSLMEYEARVNLLVAEHPITSCCLYDTRRFSGSVIMDVLSVHPLALVRGQLVKNPFYVEPAVFLAELQERSVGQMA